MFESKDVVFYVYVECDLDELKFSDVVFYVNGLFVDNKMINGI